MWKNRDNAGVFRGSLQLCWLLCLLHPRPRLPRRQPRLRSHRLPCAQVIVCHVIKYLRLIIRIRVPDIIFNHISHRNNELKILLYFRLSHYDIGGTNIVGSKLAAINLEARDIAAKHVLRKVVVARIRDVSVSDYNFLVSSGAGGLLLLLPPQGSRDLATSAVRESISTLEV